MQSQLKWIGLVLVVASCAGLGIRLAELYRQRICQCRQVEQGLQRLLGEIRFHRITLEEALRETGQALEIGCFSEFLIRVADRLAGNNRGDLSEKTEMEECNVSWEPRWDSLGQIWRQEGKRYLETSLLQEEQELLLSLGQELGTLDLEEQVRCLHQCLEQWHFQIERLQKQEETYGRLCRGMGISMGVLLAILLL